jgi:DNA (cytosine-5)-methyltransferase 1
MPAGLAYYNEIEPYAAQWLLNLIDAGLIANGVVDRRSIVDVRPDDIRPFRQCHFFAGLGGWSHALRLAGWSDDRPVWTGSCPCQPFSLAGGMQGVDDKRHLWPDWYRLIRQCRPAIVFGEQVASAAAWLALVRRNMEAVEYAVGAMPIEASSVGALHKRDRYWFVAHTDRSGWSPRDGHFPATGHRHSAPAGRGNVPDADCDQHEGCSSAHRGPAAQELSAAIASGKGLEIGEGQAGERPLAAATGSDWWATEPDVGRVAHGIPARVAHGIPARVGKLRALGNAIVPQVAAEFIGAFMECRP